MMTISTIIANYQVKQRLHFLIYLFQAMALQCEDEAERLNTQCYFLCGTFSACQICKTVI